MTTMTWNNITLKDMKTGEEVKILPNSASIISCDDCDDDQIRHSINVQNTYKFECTIKDLLPEDLRKFFETDSSMKTAYRLCDELNDLIEEYHAPRTSRRERRAIKREFDKVFKILRNHCQKHGLTYSFQRPTK